MNLPEAPSVRKALTTDHRSRGRCQHRSVSALLQPQEIHNMRSRLRLGRAVIAALGLSLVFQCSQSTFAQANGLLTISEFTARGPLGALDEYVEIFNPNPNGALVIAASDGSGGYGIAADDGVLRCTIPNGTIIPARGHFLCAGAHFIYIGDVAPDAFFVGGSPTFGDIGDSQGVALFR